MPSITINLVGNDKLLRLLAQGGPAVTRAVGRAILEEAQEIFDESQTLVPVKTGALRSSGQVEGPTMNGGNVEVQIGYGGSAAPYAEIVHERLDTSHDSPTQAKFLETPVAQHAETMAARIADKADAIIKGLA